MDVGQLSLVELKAVQFRTMERWDVLQNPQESRHADHGERESGTRIQGFSWTNQLALFPS